MPKKGAVVLVPFPFTDLSGSKVRPAVVISAHASGDDVIVAFISSQKMRMRTSNVPLRIGDKEFGKTGLKVDSHIRCDKLATLEKKVLLGELGRMPAIYLCAIDACLKRVFDL